MHAEQALPHIRKVWGNIVEYYINKLSCDANIQQKFIDKPLLDWRSETNRWCKSSAISSFDSYATLRMK